MQNLEQQIYTLQPVLKGIENKSKEFIELYETKARALQELKNTLDLDYNSNTIKGIDLDLKELNKDINKETEIKETALAIYNQFLDGWTDEEETLKNMKEFIEECKDYLDLI